MPTVNIYRLLFSYCDSIRNTIILTGISRLRMKHCLTLLLPLRTHATTSAQRIRLSCTFIPFLATCLVG